MFPFFFWFILPLLLFIFRNNTNKLLSWSVVLLLIVVAGFRDISFVGDTSNYYLWYEYGEDFFQTDGSERFYSIINIFAIRNGIPFQYIVLLMSAITVVFNFLAIKRITKEETLGLCLYVCLTFYLYSFNAQRQMAADAILLYAYTFLKEHKFKQFIFFVVIATQFHTSSIIALLLLLFMINDEYQLPKVFVTFTIIVSFFVGGLNLTQHYLGGLESLFPKYTPSDMVSGTSFSFTRFLYSVFFIYLYYSSKNKADIFLKIFYVGILLINLFSYKATAMRIAYLFTPIQILLFIPILKQSIRSEQSVVVSFYMFILYYYLTFAQAEALLDYKFCSADSLLFGTI